MQVTQVHLKNIIQRESTQEFAPPTPFNETWKPYNWSRKLPGLPQEDDACDSEGELVL